MELISNRNVPILYFPTISRDISVNPHLWDITGIDRSSPNPPERSAFAHGIVTVDDPKYGRCIILNKSTSPDRKYFNLIGGSSEEGEAPIDTFVREMNEEIGVTPVENRLMYIGLLTASKLPPIPLFQYHIETYDLMNFENSLDSSELAIIPLSALKTLPNITNIQALINDL